MKDPICTRKTSCSERSWWPNKTNTVIWETELYNSKAHRRLNFLWWSRAARMGWCWKIKDSALIKRDMSRWCLKSAENRRDSSEMIIACKISWELALRYSKNWTSTVKKPTADNGQAIYRSRNMVTKLLVQGNQIKNKGNETNTWTSIKTFPCKRSLRTNLEQWCSQTAWSETRNKWRKNMPPKLKNSKPCAKIGQTNSLPSKQKGKNWKSNWRRLNRRTRLWRTSFRRCLTSLRDTLMNMNRMTLWL